MQDTESAVLELAPVAPSPSSAAMVVQTARAGDVTPSDLLRLAMERDDGDLDRMERLMLMKERYDAAEARKAFTAAMTGFKAEPLVIFKTKGVEFTTKDGDRTSYKHAELSDVTDVVCPAMARHELSHRWNVRQEGGKIIVECVVTHVKGHSETVTMEAPPDSSGKKNAIQQISSTVSYLQRYTLLAATGVATKGMDDDGNGAGDGGGKGEERPDPVLDAFRAASLLGDVALRDHYETHKPTEAFWQKHGPSLRRAARDADADAHAEAGAQ